MTNNSTNEIVNTNEKVITINLLNKPTGTNYPKASAYGSNTLGQVVKEYGPDIGINPVANKIVFENKRTGASTSDLNETIDGLGLQDGDVLAITDDGGVA